MVAVNARFTAISGVESLYHYQAVEVRRDKFLAATSIVAILNTLLISRLISGNLGSYLSPQSSAVVLWILSIITIPSIMIIAFVSPSSIKTVLRKRNAPRRESEDFDGFAKLCRRISRLLPDERFEHDDLRDVLSCTLESSALEVVSNEERLAKEVNLSLMVNTDKKRLEVSQLVDIMEKLGYFSILATSEKYRDSKNSSIWYIYQWASNHDSPQPWRESK